MNTNRHQKIWNKLWHIYPTHWNSTQHLIWVPQKQLFLLHHWQMEDDRCNFQSKLTQKTTCEKPSRVFSTQKTSVEASFKEIPVRLFNGQRTGILCSGAQGPSHFHHQLLTLWIQLKILLTVVNNCQQLVGLGCPGHSGPPQRSVATGPSWRSAPNSQRWCPRSPVCSHGTGRPAARHPASSDTLRLAWESWGGVPRRN